MIVLQMGLCQLYGVIIVDAGDGGKGVIVNIVITEELTTFGETLFYQEAHAYNLSTRLSA